MTTNSVEESNAEMPFSLGPSMMSMNPPKADILRARDSTEFDPVKTVKRSPKSDSRSLLGFPDGEGICGFLRKRS